MSYSFNVRAPTKAEALERVRVELDKVVAAQPVHAADREHAEFTAESMLGVIPEPGEGQEVSVSVSGSVGWSGVYPDSHVLTSASVNVNASLVAKA